VQLLHLGVNFYFTHCICVQINRLFREGFEMAEKINRPPELTKTHPHLKGFMDFLTHLNSESERGQVLISASMVDNLLLEILKSFLLDSKSASKLISGFNAPLGTFSSRIEAAHALGLISDTEHQDASIIRKIRNEFAHSIAISFSDERIKQITPKLHFKAEDYEDVVVDARGQFSSAATCLILNLTNRPHYVGKERLKSRSWEF